MTTRTMPQEPPKGVGTEYLWIEYAKKLKERIVELETQINQENAEPVMTDPKSLIERMRDHLACYWKEGDVAPQVTSIELMLIEEAAAELAAAQKDAERYRWLRERHENTVMDIYNSISPAMIKPELIDAAIDAAMKKECGK